MRKIYNFRKSIGESRALGVFNLKFIKKNGFYESKERDFVYRIIVIKLSSYILNCLIVSIILFSSFNFSQNYYIR